MRVDEPSVGVRADGSTFASPFPPIADYAFLSDGEVTALVAPSGSVEWLCLPRFDSPSVFGAILDRDAGNFRLGPADNAVPVDRRYLPGTLVLETSWGTSTGWVIIRDALLMGPWLTRTCARERHRAPRPTTPRKASSSARSAASTARSRSRSTASPCSTTGDDAASGRHGDRPYHSATCRDPDSDLSLTLTTDLRRRLRRAQARRALAGEGRRLPIRARCRGPSTRRPRPTRTPTSGSSGRRTTGSTGSPAAASPTTRGAATSSAARSRSRASPTRPRAPSSPRRPRPFRRPRAASATGTTATRGSATRRSSCGRSTRSGSTGRPTTSSRSSPTSPAARDDLQIMYGIGGERTLDRGDPRPPRRVRRRATRPRRQRRLRPEAARRLGRAPRLGLPAHPSRDRLDDRVWPILVRQVDRRSSTGGEPDRGIWEVRGDPKHFTCSKVMCWVAADRGAEARPDPRRARARRPVAAPSPTRSRPTSWPTASTSVACSRSRYGTRPRRVGPAHPAPRFLPPDDDRVRRPSTPSPMS